MGTLMRSCAWFGIKILLCLLGVDPYNPKTVRAAMGAHFCRLRYKNINLSYFQG